MKNKKIIIVALLIFTIILLLNNKSFAEIIEFENGTIGDITIDTTKTAEENFENNDVQAWAGAIQYAIIHQISYVNGDTYTPLMDWEIQVLNITKNLHDNGYSFPELTQEQKDYLNATRENMTYAEQYLRVDHKDSFDFNDWANAIETDQNFYEHEYEERNPQTEETEKHTLSEILSNADNFLTKGEDDAISTDNLKKMSATIYNVFFIIGTIIAFIIGGILGIKFITSGLEGKVEVKEMLLPYIIGCVVLFGSFAIWQLVLNILKTI